MARARLGTLAVAAAALVLGGCVFGGGDATPEATPTAEVTATIAATSPPTATVAAEPTETAVAAAIPLSRSEFGAMLIDVRGAGERYTLYEGRSFFWSGDSFYPGFAADGSVWVSVDETAGARRFSVTAGWSDEVAGAWGASSSADGDQIAYYRRDGDALSRELVIEHAGGTEVVSGEVVKHEFSPDGTRVAYYLRNEDNSADLYVIDLVSGESRLLASNIDPCPCDWTPGPRWSPSGDYLAYSDYGWGPEDEPFGGGYVVAVAGGQPIETPPIEGWLPAVAPDQLLVRSNDEIAILDPANGRLRSLAVKLGDGVFRSPGLVGRLPFVQVVATGPDRDSLTWLIDAESGDPAVSWPVIGTTTVMASGPAIAIGRDEAPRAIQWSCAGVLILHATHDELACLEGADVGVWSPDGSYLAVEGGGGSPGESWAGVWSPADGLFLRFDVPRGVSHIEWDDAGTQLLVAWGSPL